MRRDGPSDKTIVRRARQGDRQAFLTLLQRYDPRLRRLALRLLADPNRLERILTRAYLKAWRSLPFLTRGEAVPNWLYRIVYNTCLNEMRWEPTRPPPPPPDGPPVPLPAASVERRLLALRALKATERIPLVLVDGEGFSLEDAARMMRRDPTTVATDLAKARGRWRAFVCGEEHPAVDETEPSAAPADPRAKPPLPAPVLLPGTMMASLANLGLPPATREPGGHVRLLSPHPGSAPHPLIPAKSPPIRDKPTSRPAILERATAAKAASLPPPPPGDPEVPATVAAIPSTSTPPVPDELDGPVPSGTGPSSPDDQSAAPLPAAASVPVASAKPEAAATRKKAAGRRGSSRGAAVGTEAGPEVAPVDGSTSSAAGEDSAAVDEAAASVGSDHAGVAVSGAAETSASGRKTVGRRGSSRGPAGGTDPEPEAGTAVLDGGGNGLTGDGAGASSPGAGGAGTGSGAGARRKRRRDAKRAVRSRGRSAASGNPTRQAAPPAPQVPPEVADE